MHRDDLSRLVQSTGFPRISIYIPTHKTYPEAEQDRIRMANSLKEAERQLSQAGLRNIDALLSSAQQRTKETVFWRYQDRGLAVFIEQGETYWLKLPAEVPETIVIAARYHVLPLIDIFADRGGFHLLAVTRDSLRFFDGAERELQEIDVDDLPGGLGEVKARTNFEDNVGYHPRGRTSQVGGATTPKYHALGESPEDYDDVELEHFVREVAKAIDSHLAERTAPLVLAARPRLLGRLRQALRYRQVAKSAVQRDPTSMTDSELHAEAWAVAGPLLREDRDKARARLRARLEGAEIPGSNDLEELMRSTAEGRVATLLVSRGATIWGRYDEPSRKLHAPEEPGPDNEDILNLLAVKVLAQGGEVIALPEDLARQTGPAAGLFRY